MQMQAKRNTKRAWVAGTAKVLCVALMLSWLVVGLAPAHASDNVITVDPALASLRPGDTLTIDVLLTIDDMYGVQFDLTFNPSIVQVNSITEGFAWTGRDHSILKAEYDNTAGTASFAAYLERPAAPMSREDAKITTLVLEALAPGTTDLAFEGVIVSDIDGQALTVGTEDGALEVRGVSCLEGVIELQGRTDWSGATIVLAGGRAGTLTAETDAAGEWMVCDVIADTYNLTVEMPGYLSAAWPGLEIGAAGAELDPMRLLAGDCDNNDEIDIFDAAILGAAFDSSPPLDARADLNDDGVVNILDAALLGGNWGLTGPLTW